MQTLESWEAYLQKRVSFDNAHMTYLYIHGIFDLEMHTSDGIAKEAREKMRAIETSMCSLEDLTVEAIETPEHVDPANTPDRNPAFYDATISLSGKDFTGFVQGYGYGIRSIGGDEITIHPAKTGCLAAFDTANENLTKRALKALWPHFKRFHFITGIGEDKPKPEGFDSKSMAIVKGEDILIAGQNNVLEYLDCRQLPGKGAYIYA